MNVSFFKDTVKVRIASGRCLILNLSGAAATVDALPQLTGNAFNAVKGVFLIGNPDHKSGKSSATNTKRCRWWIG